MNQQTGGRNAVKCLNGTFIGFDIDPAMISAAEAQDADGSWFFSDMEAVIGKIRELKDSGYKGEIEADGGIREDNLELLAANGLTVAVMGTALFRNEDMAACVKRLHKLGK